MFLSIIIPVYNCEKYLASCLDSCLDQELPEDAYEMICINDGSTDSCAEILADYSCRYGHIKVFSQENRGVSAARNVGLDHAKGAYIMFLDGDDLIRRNCLRDIRETLEETDCDRLKMNAYIGASDAADRFRSDPDTGSFSVFAYDIFWMSVYKREIIESHHIRFVEGVTNGEDDLFMTDYKYVCSDVTEYQLVFYFYRRYSGTSIDSNIAKNVRNMVRSFMKIVVICSDRIGATVDVSNLIYYVLWTKYMSRLFFFFPEFEYTERRETLTELKNARPFPHVNRTERDTLGSSLYRAVRRTVSTYRMELALFSTAFGAHLICVRRKLSDSKFGYLMKHPKILLKKPKEIKAILKSKKPYNSNNL